MVVNHLYYNDAQPAGTPSQSFSFSPKLLQQALQNIYGPSFDPEKDIEPTFWQTFTKAFNQAADQGFSQSSYNPSQAFTSALRHSNAVFAAFKTHRLQNDLAQLLTDSNGNLKPFQQWKKDILPIASHQCQHWLQTEYDTAVIRAHQAADWQQFQAEKDVLPNLRWVPSTSPNPGADHLPFWNTVLPVDHPFWDQHRPGDRWNCKCSLSATDDPATSVPTVPASSAGGNRPHPGLDTNPGKTAQLFSDTHPYIKNAYPGAKEAVEKAVKKAEKKIIKQELRKAVQGQSITSPQFPHQILVSRASIDEWVNQPFKYMKEKAQMLFNIQNIIRQAEYVGTSDKKGGKIVQSHIFKTKVKDIDAYIIVQEFVDGKFILHSISDAQDFMKYVKIK